MKKHFVYKIEHIESLNSYTGYSGNIEVRWDFHRSALKNKRHHCPHLQAAWTKYGPKAFRFEIIAEYPSEGKALEAETVLESFCFLAGTSYNAVRGGTSRSPGMAGRRHKEKSIEKMRVSSTGIKHTENTKAILRETSKTAFKGRHHTKEVREICRKANLGRTQMPETVEKRISHQRGKKHSDGWKENISLGHDMVKYKALGEEKTLYQWSIDSRCIVDNYTLRNRVINLSWDIEKAMYANVIDYSNYNKLHTAFGETKTMSEWSKDSRCLVKYNTLRQRVITKKWSIEEALTTPSKKNQQVLHENVVFMELR